jgi:mannose-6-phosphate isomerase-like protein (cupin superfamily)
MSAAGRMVAPGAGRLVDLGGVGVQFKIPGELTGEAFSVVEHPVEPGVVVEPHVHVHEDELSFVVEGSIWARVGDEEMEVPAGGYLWKPRGVLHTFWNPGPRPARLVELISPAGFEHFFAELAELLPSDPAEHDIEELCTRYGLSFDQTWLPDIQARFGPLRLV